MEVEEGSAKQKKKKKKNNNNNNKDLENSKNWSTDLKNGSK